ncbi:hypothetical protein PO124_20270 [Bacillus licheniformis]|nr:hypothetical protein [Bacillus licheniformis]
MTERLAPGDYVLIQFGHNDQNRTEQTLIQPIRSILSAMWKRFAKTSDTGLITSAERRRLIKRKARRHTRGFPKAMKALADSFDVPLIDLWSKQSAL